jgi:4-phytase/acid phosphatase/peptide/nickel transport system substrate-binding protein
MKTTGLIALAAAAAALGISGPAFAQKKGGSLDIPGFDPLKVGVYDTAGNMGAALIFETLVRLDANGKPAPRLAESWTNSDDFRTWTFKLRPGVKFHDGTPFNAAAVKENFDRQKDPKNNCRCAFYIANTLSVEAKDDLTVVYTLKDPAVNFPALLTRPDQNSSIHSPTAWKAKGDDYNPSAPARSC